MTPVEAGLLWLAWAVMAGTPGPATMTIAGTSMERGRRAGAVSSLGIMFGSAAWGLAAAAGLSGVMLANAWVFEALRYGGAAYLLWLAIKSLRSAFSSPDKAVSGFRVQSGTLRRVFIKASLIHLTNPKAILAWGSIYAIILPATAAPVQVFGLFAFLYSGSAFTFLLYAVIFSTPAMVRAYARAKRWFEFTFAGFFGYASLKVFTAQIEN